MVIFCLAGMAVVGDNRGGRQRSVEQRPDGSWHLDDARKRRDQRTKGQPNTAPISERDDDPAGYALSLADSALTSDGRPLSHELLAEQPEPASSALTVPAVSDPAQPQRVAHEILLELQSARQRAAPSGQRGAPGPELSSPRRRRTHKPGRRLRILIAGAATAVACVTLVVTLASGTHPPSREGASQGLAGVRANPIASVNAAAAYATLAIRHAADRKLPTVRDKRAATRRRRPRAHHTPQRASAPHSGGTQVVDATAASSATSQPTATTPQHVSSGSDTPASTSNSSSYNPPPADTTPQDTHPAQSSQTPSQPAGPSGPGGTIDTNCNPKCQ